VFNGRIHIHRDAQKTKAELSNKNLLTSTRAEINTKPELEIYADDVQCAHGATVAQIDELALHYLRTRGVSRAEAETMLSFGFINEVIDSVRCSPLRDYLQLMLARRFSRDPLLVGRSL
jgi:Fe-S cluster assembly protein SufD